MAVTDFVVAIELGSTQITGIAGKRNADSSIHIIAKESEDSTDCIKKGAIFNLDKTTQLLTNIIKRLEEDLQSSIKKVYVGISGKSLRSINNIKRKEFSEETKISQALIDSIMQSNREFPLVDLEILSVEPQEYKIGNNLLTEPVGINAEAIEANFLNITARPSLKENIIQCFRHTGCEIADFIISPIANANTTLTETEKRSGCALVDIGASTTTVSVYKNNILRKVAVIPLGGNNITKDICSMRFEEDEAEELKLRYGSAFTEDSDDADYNDKSYSLDGKNNIKAIQLESIVEARINEIIKNVWNQITQSSYGDKLMSGIILTGGTSNLPNIEKAFNRITKVEKIRIAKESRIQTEGLKLPKDGTTNTLIGILAAGKENCCRVDPKIGHTIDFVDNENTDKVAEPAAEKEQVKEETTLEIEAAEPAQEIEVKEETTPTTQNAEANVPEQPVETEEDIRRKEANRKRECQVYINRAVGYMETRKYDEALHEISIAREYEVPSKKAELDSLEKEAARLKKEAERLIEIKREKQIQDAEKQRRRREDCERLLNRAKEALDKNDIEEARDRTLEAKDLNIYEYQSEINDILEKTRKDEKKKGWFSKAWKKFVNVSEDIMKDN